MQGNYDKVLRDKRKLESVTIIKKCLQRSLTSEYSTLSRIIEELTALKGHHIK